MHWPRSLINYAAHFGILDFDGGGATGRVGVHAYIGVELLQRTYDGRLLNVGRTSIVEVLAEAGIELAAGVGGAARAGAAVGQQGRFADGSDDVDDNAGGHVGRTSGAAGVTHQGHGDVAIKPHRTPTWMTLFEVVVFAGVF